MKRDGSEEKLIDLKKIYAIIRKNWMVMGRDKIRLVMLLIFPIVMITIFGYTAGRVPTNVAGGLVDYDNSQTSREVQTALYADNIFSIEHLYGSQDEGRRALESGDIKILFIIPPGFENDIQSGKQVAISIILDESDPTIAQLTRGSTQAFIQAISDKIKSERISMISLKAQEAQQYLSSSDMNLYVDSEGHMKSIQSNFMDASQVYSGTNSILSGTVQNMKNSIGYVQNPNEIISFVNNNTNTLTRQDTLSIFGTLAAQQAGVGQVNFYQGLQGANARLYQDTSKIYSDANSIYANSIVESTALTSSKGTLNLVSQDLGEISNAASMTSSNAVVVSEIEPYGSGRTGLDFLVPSIIALTVFQGAIMGMGRAVAGERRDGSLTRVFLTPTSNVTILSGTLLFYVFFETVRSSFLVFVAMLIFGVTIKGSILSILFIIWIYAAGATGLGMILSVISKSQEQFMALSALITLPSMFLAGVFLPIQTMPSALQGVARALPITYASDALRGVMIKGFGLSFMLSDILILFGFALLTLAVSIMVFKRELI
jgi:ABC transporter DrrB family efflux protein